jgi:hypothetical protein
MVAGHRVARGRGLPSNVAIHPSGESPTPPNCRLPHRPAITDASIRHQRSPLWGTGHYMRHRLVFRLVVAILLSLLLSSCASARNTLAQDLAWERWEQCRTGGVVLNRITPDGRIWVTYMADHGNALREWQECDRKAAAEQGRQQAASSAPSRAAVARPKGADALGPIQAPVWNVGDEWAYRYESPSGAGTFVWAVDRIELLDGQEHYVIKTGTREIFYRTADFAFTRESLDGAVVRRDTPANWRWTNFPMAVGDSWSMKFREERPLDGQTEDVARSCRVEGEEAVTVPAGTFPTFRVVCRNTRNDAWYMTSWYAPQIKQAVRVEFAVTGSRQTRELIKYRHR